uniref:Uncharacterized protein n=1 Tax=Populus trichocarpa TaxID=3694 RepID=A0A2K1Z941_POPTR
MMGSGILEVRYESRRVVWIQVYGACTQARAHDGAGMYTHAGPTPYTAECSVLGSLVVLWVLIQELIDDKVWKTVRDEHDLILLPMQLWSSLEGNKGGHKYRLKGTCSIGRFSLLINFDNYFQVQGPISAFQSIMQDSIIGTDGVNPKSLACCDSVMFFNLGFSNAWSMKMKLKILVLQKSTNRVLK